MTCLDNNQGPLQDRMFTGCILSCQPVHVGSSSCELGWNLHGRKSRSVLSGGSGPRPVPRGPASIIRSRRGRYALELRINAAFHLGLVFRLTG